MSLDPKTNRRERESDKAQNHAEAPPFNPPFPYKRRLFDPFNFALNSEPREAAPIAGKIR